MKYVFEKINKALVPFFWPIIVTIGYLSGTFAFFIIFRHNLINDFIKDDLLGTSRIYLVLFLIFFTAFFVFLASKYRKEFEERLVNVVIIAIGIFFAFKIRSYTGGSFIFFAYLSFVLTYILSFSLLKNINEKIKNPKKFLIGTLVFFLISFSFYSVFKHMKLESHAYDLGIFTQAMYKFSIFDFSENTVRAIENLWGDHFHPILVPFSLLMWIYPHAETVVIIQALVVCLGGIPLYLIAKDALKNKVAAVFIVGAYLFSVGIQKAIDFDFHEITLMPTFLFLSFYLLNKKNWKWYFISLVPLLACKENVSILVIFLGLYLVFVRKEKMMGFYTSVIGLVWFAVATMLIIPSLANAGFIYFEYDILGATPKEALASLFTNPLHGFYALFNHPYKINTAWTFLSSFGFLPLLSPTTLFLAIPTFGEVMWNNSIYRWQGFHYGASTAPILALAAIYGISNLRFIISKFYKIKGNELVAYISLFVLICSFVVSQNDRTIFERLMEPGFYKISPAYYDIKKLGVEIPKEAHLSTLPNIVPQFAARKYIYGYPGNRFEQGRVMDYYLLSVDAQSNLEKRLEIIWEIENFILNRKDYGLYKKLNNSFIFKRGYNPDDQEEAMALEYLQNERKTCQQMLEQGEIDAK